MPKQKPHTLISTVGTSLLGNLKRLPEKPSDAEENNESKGPEGLDWSTVEKLKRHYNLGEWKALGRCLAEVPAHFRLCGAEINSIHSLAQKDWLEMREIVFLVSDTNEGRITGEILVTYFESRKDDLRLQNARYVCIDGLQDERPWEFRTVGLRNLVREIGKIVRDVGSPAYVAIDATGGYKAQIAVAALIGVAMDIDVYYSCLLYTSNLCTSPFCELLQEKSEYQSNCAFGCKSSSCKNVRPHLQGIFPIGSVE